ncbi:DUF1648 domain-containing protein [Chloroflexota bacterium]
MGTRSAHPLWTHLPAVAALVVLIIYLVTNGPLPAEAPVHFGFGGVVDRYGSPWSVFGITIGLSVFFILLSAFLDELWARQEKAKTFNWLSLLDEIVVGAMTGISLGYLSFIKDNAGPFHFPWPYFGLMFGIATALAVILEMARPYRPYPGQLVAQDDQALTAELTQRLKDNSPFVFWDCQNPFYVTLLTTVLPLGMLVAAVLSWFSQPWVSVILIITGIILVIPHGGQRTIVTRQELTVRWGLVGIRVLRLKTQEIAGLDIHEFAPLKDFGGYGIRFNREMTAYYLRGTRGSRLPWSAARSISLAPTTPNACWPSCRSSAGQGQ